MRVYMDNAATTRVIEPVFEAMKPYLCDIYGNPSSVHGFGREALTALDRARGQVAAALGAQSSEIYFTGCGTESDNWAIRGAAYARKDRGNHIITTQIEHHAVLHTCQQLEKEGFEVTYLPVDEFGLVHPEELEKALRPETTVVSIMYANNEIGTIQPIPEIGAICRERGVWFHTDAVQAIGNVEINVKEQNIDMLSLSGHKIHAQKGTGALYLRNGIRIPNLIDGGAQERGRRAGTENVAAIVGLAKAMETACSNIEERARRLSAMRDRLIDGVLKIERSRLNGDRERRLPGNANFCFEGIEGESLLLLLDMAGICGSSGSACTSGSLDPSHVLLAIGLPHEIAHGSLRLSFSDQNTEEDVDYILETLPGIVERLRAMSPLWDKINKAKP